MLVASVVLTRRFPVIVSVAMTRADCSFLISAMTCFICAYGVVAAPDGILSAPTIDVVARSAARSRGFMLSCRVSVSEPGTGSMTPMVDVPVAESYSARSIEVLRDLGGDQVDLLVPMAERNGAD